MALHTLVTETNVAPLYDDKHHGHRIIGQALTNTAHARLRAPADGGSAVSKHFRILGRLRISPSPTAAFAHVIFVIAKKGSSLARCRSKPSFIVDQAALSKKVNQ